ncbi:MAG: methyltransferase domain-containing protein [Phycisphaerae bacterium]|nr:methyltransferase domain-containing protein [Phycisphaerae bacterium]
MEHTARDTAVQALRDRDGHPSRYLRYLLARTQLPPADRALARELAMGAVRRRDTLDAVIRAYLAQPDKKLPSPTDDILRVALYQILFLDRVPNFAAVDEAVEQASRFHHKRQQGFINGLLRAILRDLPDAPAEILPPSADAVPRDDGTSLHLGKAVFPDPRANPTEYIAATYSLPLVLAERWRVQFGPEKMRELARHSIARPPLICRVNGWRSSVEAVLASLAEQNQPARAHENGLSVVIDPIDSLMSLQAFRDGLIQPQDPTATAVVAAARVKPGDRVLDFCAAPGTKTTHLAERMENRGEIVAVDVTEEKCQRIETNCRRLGIDIVKTCTTEQLGRLELQSFNLVLADVPCGNTGVLARRPEAKWRFEEDGEFLSQIVRDQLSLATAAGQYVAPGGQLIYSTCSIEPEECEQMARKIAKRLDRLKLTDQKQTLPAGADNPTQWHDGGYHAIFQTG